MKIYFLNKNLSTNLLFLIYPLIHKYEIPINFFFLFFMPVYGSNKGEPKILLIFLVKIFNVVKLVIKTCQSIIRLIIYFRNTIVN